MQLWGILAGLFLLYFIGTKALIGASAAIGSGLLTYYLYGKKHARLEQTPFQSLLGDGQSEIQ